MSSKAERPTHSPAPDFLRRKIPVKNGKAEEWFRLHSVAFNAIYFSKSQANRFAINAALRWGTLYLGSDPQTCLMEKYGDEVFGAQGAGHEPQLSASGWRERRLTRVVIPPLKICDLTNEATLAACGVDVGTLTSASLDHPQKWATAILSHPADFDAIQYTSRFTLCPCLAIYNRRKVNFSAHGTEPLMHNPEANRFLDEFKVSLV